MKNLSIFFLTGLLLLAFSQPSLAAATGVSVKAQTAKIAKHLSGDGYATNQPTIRVLSTGGKKYDALDTKNIKFSITTKAAYTPNWIVKDHNVTFSGQDDSVKLNSVKKSGHYETKYIPPKFSMSPVEFCNNEVKIKGSKSMTDGFVMKIPDAYTVKYKAKFKRTILRTTHSKSDSVNIPAWVICEKTKTAKKDVKKQVPFLRSLTLKASPKTYTGICPVEVRQQAIFRVNSPGEIKYRFFGEDGSKGPNGTLKFASKGNKAVTWERMIEIPKPKPGTLAGRQVAAPNNKYNGTTTFKYVLYRGGNKIGASPPPEKVSFTVQCEEPKKIPARMQKTAPATNQMQLQGSEAKKIQ